MKLYLGISGKMGSGKTTLTQGIINSLERLKIQRVSLAKPIKDIQDMIYKELELEMEGEKDRDLLIALGMWGRSKSDTLWLDQATKKMKELDVDIVICDDVRFPNEAKWFNENGMLLRIEGEQRGPNVDPSRASDPSETSLDDFDFKYHVQNTDGVEATLMAALYAIAQHINVSESLIDSLREEITKEG